MATVGAFARIDVSAADDVRRRLDALEGVSTFDMGEPEKIGLVIEADDIDGAHAMLTRDIKNTKGVLGAWPVYAHYGSDDPEPQNG